MQFSQIKLKEIGEMRLIKKERKAAKAGFMQQLKKSKEKLILFFSKIKLAVKLKISLTKMLKIYPFVPRKGTTK